MWKISADDIIGMLKGDTTVRGDELRQRARVLLQKITSWGPKNVPSEEERKSVIADVMTLYRETHEHVASQRKP